MKAIVPVCHEFHANYLFNEHQLKPFFAADARVKAGDGKVVEQFSYDGDEWIATLYYQDSGIVHPDDHRQHLPAAIDWNLDTVREFRIAVERHPDQDPIGEQKANFHIAPRWPEMVAEKKNGSVKKISVPEHFGIGVNVSAKGANIDFHRYEPLLRAAAGAVGINRHYFQDPHDFSNVQDAERYVRLDKDESGPVHARDGPIARMSHLLENDRAGYRKIVQQDRTFEGDELPGFYHTVTLDQRRVQEMFPDHQLPVEVKHYYVRHPFSFEDDHPLRHPKLGASFQVSQFDGKIGVSDEDLTQLKRELDRIVRSVLANAGLDVAPERGNGPYFEDPYFPIDVAERGPDPVSLDLTRIRQESESIVVKHLADGLSPVQWETLETAVTDGGQLSPADVAEENDRHLNSVYRALRGMDDLLERAYGKVSLKNSHVAELVLDAVERARESHRRAVETVAKAEEATERGIDETTSAFVAWCAKHGIDVDDRSEARMKIRLSDEPKRVTRQRMKRAYNLWVASNRDPARFRQAQVVFDRGPKATASQYLRR
ncbi:Protein containing HTH domain [Halanaeroarchaeum sp. HSR-CO]|uniref:DUF7845 domain-containing protein n=1 Tax=Halanaeroarchaeum sp. HSR-CO TaxID=2866382 RepID=UPI00217D1444|nr:MarR family transcriptional regulator [Halanaeroarchaeum sp. HSR-CO]UWG47058.1 Protein containing HTH domain [Halanaeroarchaeum sp. HSR-CO]